jgi:hypothetical protein
MERDLRHAMDLESPFMSPALQRRKLTALVSDIDDGNDGDDEVSVEEDLSFPFSPEDCSQMAKILGLGLLSPKNLDVLGVDGEIDFFIKKDDDVDLMDFAGQSSTARHQDDIFQDIFELDEAELNLPPWLLSASKSSVVEESINQKALLSKSDADDEVSTSFKALPTKLMVEAPSDEEEDRTAVDEKFDFGTFLFFYYNSRRYVIQVCIA